MVNSRKQFKRESPDQRQDDLIAATLRLIASGGPEAATVRNIAMEAGVTPGLIRHYFSTKEDLIGAAYERHMTTMRYATYSTREGALPGAVARLAALVTASLTAPVTDPRAMALWAGFIQSVQRDAAMHAIHEKTYFQFRDQLQMFISDAFIELGQPKDQADLRKFAIACNAVLDGLWLEGSALPDTFETGELPAIGLASIGAILGMKLEG
ncbi:MAG: TetR family transcriptional regulator C-terminal domain-containing protein [Proteobacteria bacterium]|nr:TetR family transcriptional regulator C-terminal domain-containing protein [Pseudomonadota bacterium]